MRGDGTPTISLADDDRARIPFALIGVLLLVSSATTVGVLESRPEPEVDVDPSLAMDRTAAAAGTELRNAVVRAADRTAVEPVTRPNRNDPWGRAIDGADSTEVFERYLKLRIYLEAEERLERAGQEVRSDTVTRVSVPRLENDEASAEEAIDRVRLEAGYEAGTDLDPGLVRVTLADVTISLERDGVELARETRDVTVTVATTVFELHRTTEAYERQLDTGFFEAEGYEGFGRYFAARAYPLAWGRGYAQYAGAPVSEVIANRHVEVLANDAVFAAQESVFGVADPYRDRTMANAWGCLAAKDAEEIYEGAYGEPTVLDAEDVCSGLEYVYGDVEGELGDPPEASDLLAGAPGMDETETIEVGPVADVAFAETLASGEVRDVVTELHEIDAGADVFHRIDGYDEPSVSRPSETYHDPDNWSDPVVREERTTTLSTTVEHVEHEPDAESETTDYHTFEVTVVNEHFEEREWVYEGNRSETGLPASVTANDTTTSEFAIEVVLSGEHPDADVAENGVDDGYDPGGWPRSPVPGNYDGIPEDALESLLGLDPDRPLEAQLEDRLTDPEGLESAADLERELDVVDEATLDAEPRTDLLFAEIAADLALLRDDVAGVTHEFERHELLRGNPFGELRDAVDDERRYVYGGAPNDRYESVPDKARVEVRKLYLRNLVERIDRVDGGHDELRAGLEEELGDEVGAADDALADVTDFARDALAGDVEAHEGELEGSPLLENVTFTPAGSPTYLSLETVDRERVPPAGDAEHAPLAAKNHNWFAIPHEGVGEDVFSRVYGFLRGQEPADEDVLAIRTAGELLEAAELAARIEGEAFLDDERRRLRGAIESELDAVAAETAGRVGGGAYAGTAHVDRSEIESILAEEAFPSLGDGSVERQAIELGSGDGADHVYETVRRELESPPDTSPYDDEDVWREHVASLVRYELTEALEDGYVELGELDDGEIDRVNERVRDELAAASEEVIEHRLGNDSTNATDLEEEWLTNEEGELSPNRIPAGLPIAPIPGYWFATANVWDVEIEGEYARFELRAASGTPARSGGTTYVRDAGRGPVSLEGPGAVDHPVGTTDPVSFSSRTVVLVVVPAGSVGVGDRAGDRTECSATWPDVGPDPHDPSCRSDR